MCRNGECLHGNEMPASKERDKYIAAFKLCYVCMLYAVWYAVALVYLHGHIDTRYENVKLFAQRCGNAQSSHSCALWRYTHKPIGPSLTIFRDFIAHSP